MATKSISPWGPSREMTTRPHTLSESVARDKLISPTTSRSLRPATWTFRLSTGTTQTSTEPSWPLLTLEAPVPRMSRRLTMSWTWWWETREARHSITARQRRHQRQKMSVWSITSTPATSPTVAPPQTTPTTAASSPQIKPSTTLSKDSSSRKNQPWPSNVSRWWSKDVKRKKSNSRRRNFEQRKYFSKVRKRWLLRDSRRKSYTLLLDNSIIKFNH